MKNTIPKMYGVVALVAAVGVVAVVSASFGASYRYDTVTFVPASPVAPAAGPAPSVRIDTNPQMSGMFGGTVKTAPPYSIGIDYTDATSTVKEAEIDRIVVTYDDGSTEPKAAALKLPWRIPSRPFESINSMAGGRVVTTRLRVISDALPGVVSRSAPVTIVIEGRLVHDDGVRTPFSVDRRFDAVVDRTTRSWAEVMSGI